MYALTGPLSDVTIDPGRNILLMGPAASGKKGLSYEILATGLEAGEGAIVVSTTDSAKRIRQDVTTLLSADLDDYPLGIVDAVSRQQGDTLPEFDHVKYTSSPVDMTGIGISLSELLETFHRDRELQRTRVCLNSISTLLMYAEVQTVFQFLHVFTGRIQNVDGLGMYLIDPSAHDEQTLNTIKGLFDGVIEVPADEDEAVTYTALGL